MGLLARVEFEQSKCEALDTVKREECLGFWQWKNFQTNISDMKTITDKYWNESDKR